MLNSTLDNAGDGGAAPEVAHSSNILLSVPARWRLQPVDQAAVEGQSVSFHCQVGGVPTPSVTWTIKSGQALSPVVVICLMSFVIPVPTANKNTNVRNQPTFPTIYNFTVTTFER